MPPNDDDQHRASDKGASLSLQDAMGLFALRTEMAAQGTLLTQVTQQIVPRTEQELRWRLSEERQDRIEQEMREDRQDTQKKLDNLDGKLETSNVKLDTLRDEVRSSRLPQWALWAIGLTVSIVGPLLAVLAAKLIH